MPTPREKVLEFLEDLVQFPAPNVRICVSSRPAFDIQTVLGPLTPFRVSLHDESGQKKDIIDYTGRRKLRSWDRKWTTGEADVIDPSQQADGM